MVNDFGRSRVGTTFRAATQDTTLHGLTVTHETLTQSHTTLDPASSIHKQNTGRVIGLTVTWGTHMPSLHVNR